MVRLANLATTKSSIEVSLSPLSSLSSVPSTAMSSLTQESTRYKKHGVTYINDIRKRRKAAVKA